MDWSYALSQGLAAGAKSGGDIIDQRMKDDMAAQAEQRAADIKLDTAERMAAIEQAMKVRAAERFSGVVKDKMGEEVPVSAAPVGTTGISRDSAHAAGLEDGLAVDPANLKRITQSAQDTLLNPSATDQQREDARALMAQIGAQSTAQADINKQAVDGKTRPRTIDEASEAALADTMQNDAGAFIAGTGMLASANKTDIEEKKLASRERIASEATDRRERADNLRYEAMMARIEAVGGGKNGQGSALVQNLNYLKENLGWSNDQLADYVTEKKRISPEDIAANLLSHDKFGDLTPEAAMEKAMALTQARDKLGNGKGDPGAAAQPSIKALPTGAKQIGTSGGKPVYQTPDGKRFIQG